MGFSVAVSFGPLNLYRICYHKSSNLVNFGQREGYARNLKLSNSRPRLRSISCCKPEVFEFEERTSPNEVKKEIERCYELIHRLGRGVVYLGSSRMGSNHPHYLQALELGREIAGLLDCTSWTGAGPGLMDAAIKGALQAGKPVGGFKIGKEAGEWTATNFHPYLPSENYLTCRKHGLVDAAVRSNSSDRTAVVSLPGGIGTLDEVFEILALIQLQRIGSELPVPFLLMNYDSFYSKLLEFLDDCEHWGTVAKGEVSSLWKVCNNNLEALAYLEEFYDLPTDKFRGGDSLRHPYRTVS
ncbi:uncharacterized protein LOC130771922 isoform X2 [Actinidia eriantha]|uniref:uncharacterized protein LOC130771922 isoform X2 n=1 Tax=Actinidia eriantha TaxID=165200 RepID=UPI00258C7985|nr:uncharacterized protein LOC130771922 isoform X2 [Actinidia eriantha]